MMENHQPLTSLDGASNRNTPERFLHAHYSQDCTEENHSVPQEGQGDLTDIKTDVIKEEKGMYVRGDQQCKEEEIPTDISTASGSDVPPAGAKKTMKRKGSVEKEIAKRCPIKEDASAAVLEEPSGSDVLPAGAKKTMKRKGPVEKEIDKRCPIKEDASAAVLEEPSGSDVPPAGAKKTMKRKGTEDKEIDKRRPIKEDASAAVLEEPSGSDMPPAGAKKTMKRKGLKEKEIAKRRPNKEDASAAVLEEPRSSTSRCIKGERSGNTSTQAFSPTGNKQPRIVQAAAPADSLAVEVPGPRRRTQSRLVDIKNCVSDIIAFFEKHLLNL
ncbi:uncharacterized protein LOC135057475 isoform X2 [Pseudophryne corroboree]|uniref:uncharacterized protein LOC135057475 isoform X2 n=1 Tax=Pseudophryne corroboree TaxID=495146 RepID=UPI003081B167